MIRTRGRMLEPTKAALRAELALAREELDMALLVAASWKLAAIEWGAIACLAAFALGLLAGVIW